MIPPLRVPPTLLALLALFALGGCGSDDNAAVSVAVVGDPGAPFVTAGRLPYAAELVRAATVEGLVALDEQGRVIPALADRWIVTDDGLSYIFRLRRAFWANGARVAAPDVARMLMARIESLRRLDPDGPLDAVQAAAMPEGQHVVPHASRTIRAVTAQEALAHLAAQQLVGQITSAARPGQPGIEAASRDTERLAHQVHRPGPSVFRDEAELHIDSLAK